MGIKLLNYVNRFCYLGIVFEQQVPWSRPSLCIDAQRLYRSRVHHATSPYMHPKIIVIFDATCSRSAIFSKAGDMCLLSRHVTIMCACVLLFDWPVSYPCLSVDSFLLRNILKV